MRRKNAQGLLEYIVLFVIIVTAILVMYKYIIGSVNARLKQSQEELRFKK